MLQVLGNVLLGLQVCSPDLGSPCLELSCKPLLNGFGVLDSPLNVKVMRRLLDTRRLRSAVANFD